MFNRKKKYNYTPMTDEEIRQSQEKLGIVKPKVHVVKQPQVLYGPPPMREEVVVEMPQVLYGPPPVQEEVVVEMPQVLYGPPPAPEEIEVDVQDLYGPPRPELEEMIREDNERNSGNQRKR